eukprot:1375681-Amorphochlora_amoeboformis.AAC.1
MDSTNAVAAKAILTRARKGRTAGQVGMSSSADHSHRRTVQSMGPLPRITEEMSPYVPPFDLREITRVEGAECR